MVQFGYKFRLKPTVFQKEFFERHFGCCRFIYNRLLNIADESYKNGGVSIDDFALKREIAKLKKSPEYEWLKEVNSQSLQESALNLIRARKRFFKKLGSRPKFKRKFYKQSFKIPQHFCLRASRKGKYYLQIPKLKREIRVYVHRDMAGAIKNITISKTPSGEYFASFNCEVPEELISRRVDNCDREVGFDLGLKDFVVTSDGEKIKAPKFFRKAERKLKSSQRASCKKKKGSANYYKNKKQVAVLHKKISNQRGDFLNKKSFQLVDENQVIYAEDLNVKGMMQNRCLAKSIGDAGFGEFVRQLKYKAAWRGKKFIQIGRFEPSSKLCSACGFKNNELKLHHRVWTCKCCKITHDRDINAAKNIKKLGQDMSKVKPVERPTSTFSIRSYCEKRMQVDSGKQEPLLKC